MLNIALHRLLCWTGAALTGGLCLASASAFEPGDVVVVVALEAQIKSGTEVVETVPPGTELVVRKVNDPWLSVLHTVQPGWIRATNVAAPAAALELFEQRVAEQPDEAVWRHARGLVQAGQGDFAAAIADFSAVLAREPDNVPALANRAVCKLESGDLEGAAEDYAAAIERAPRDVALRLNHGACMTQLGQWAAAHADYRAALRAAPRSVAVQIALAWLLATCPDDELRNGEAAVTLAERAAQTDNYADPLILNTLAAALAEAGEFAEAVRVQNLALERLSPQTESYRESFREQLRQFARGQPYHQSPAEPNGEEPPADEAAE